MVRTYLLSPGSIRILMYLPDPYGDILLTYWTPFITPSCFLFDSFPARCLIEKVLYIIDYIIVSLFYP